MVFQAFGRVRLSAIRVVITISFLGCTIDSRPFSSGDSHHIVNSSTVQLVEELDQSSELSEQTSHDLIIKLILDLIHKLPPEKLNELDATLSNGTVDTLDLPQGDMPVLEDVVDVEDQTISKDPVSNDQEEYRGEVFVLDYMNSSFSANSSIPDFESSKLPKIRERDNDTVDIRRDKDLHLKTIKNKILQFFKTTGRKPGNWNGTNPEHKEMLKEVLKQVTNMSPIIPAPQDYTEKIQSFYPSCHLPPNTDEELWNGGQVMNLIFNLSYPPSINGSSVYVIAAKLRLFKLSNVNSTVTLSENCSPTQDGGQKPVKFCSVQIGGNVHPADEKQVRVSIYRYTRSLKKYREKRKLLDSAMVTVGGEMWTEWNIKAAVKAWRDAKNFGLAVQVEDEEGSLLPATKFFATINCSKETTTMKPMPGFLMDAARIYMSQNRSDVNSTKVYHQGHIDSFLFPMIDLSTTEMSEDQHLKMSIQETLKNNTSNFSGQSKSNAFLRLNNSSYEQEKHRIRHHSRRKLPDTQPDEPVSSQNQQNQQNLSEEPRVSTSAKLEPVTAQEKPNNQ